MTCAGCPRPITRGALSMNNPDLLKMARWCRWMLAFVFIYHGLVPKLLFPSPVEVQMIEAA